MDTGFAALMESRQQQMTQQQYSALNIIRHVMIARKDARAEEGARITQKSTDAVLAYPEETRASRAC